MSELLFTSASILDLLSKIEELKDLDIGVSETVDGKVQLQVGSSVYEIEPQNVADIEVDESIVSEVEDTNLEAYENITSDENSEVVNFEPVEAGIIKEIAKTLLVGGMVRLTGKLLKK